MPRGKWSAKDERKYEHIYEACVFQARRKNGRKAGITKTCKRIAAATVNRDRALGDLGMGNLLERAIESAGPMDGRRRRGLGAQALSVTIPSGMGRLSTNREGLTFEEWRRAAAVAPSTQGAHAAWARGEDPSEWRVGVAVTVPRALRAGEFQGLGGAWQKGDRELKSGAWFKRKGNRMALMSDADDTLAPPGRGEVLVSISEGDDETFSDYFQSSAEAEEALRRRGFGGLRGTPAQHRKEAKALLENASSLQDRGFGPDYVERALIRARQEARWLPKKDRVQIEQRANEITDRRFPRVTPQGNEAYDDDDDDWQTNWSQKGFPRGAIR